MRRKLLLLILLTLLTSKAFAINESDLVGEPASTLPGVLGKANDKIENNIKNRKVWFYRKHKVYIENDLVKKVVLLNAPEKISPIEDPKTKKEEVKTPPKLRTKSALIQEQKVFTEIMKELESKSEPADPKKAKPNRASPFKKS